MKHKLNFLMIITALLTFSSFTLAQRTPVKITEPSKPDLENTNPYTPASRVTLKLQTVAKYHMVVTVLETKDLYAETKSKDEFVMTLIKLYGKSPVSESLKEYLGVVYNYHQKGTDSDSIWQQERGDAFVKMTNKMIGITNRGTSKKDIEKELFPDLNFDDQRLKKPWWVNPIRKIVDFIDDHWQ